MLLLVAVVVVLAGCHVQVDTKITVNPDGSGTVAVAVGLDAAAMARVGDLQQQAAVDDLRAAGWTVEAPVQEGDTTWLRAHHEVADTTELARVVSQLNGTDGPWKDLAAGRRDTFLERVTEFRGTFDLTKGPALFSDPELDAQPGNPWQALLDRIAAEEGRPATEMVDFSVTVELPGGTTQTWRPSFADGQPTEIAAKSTESKLVDRLTTLLIVVLLIGTGLIVWRLWVVRRRRTRRMMAGRINLGPSRTRR